MLRNHITIALRNLRKNPGYSVINIMGLSIGIACCLLIMLTVKDETSFDRHHDQAEDLYRVYQDLRGSAIGDGKLTFTAAIMAPLMVQDLPEVEQAVRVKQEGLYVSFEDPAGAIGFKEEAFTFADPALFDLFSYRFLAGRPETALTDPQSVVVTEEVARKYFGTDDPMGKLLKLNHSLDLRVTGVLETPANTNLAFDLIAPLEAYRQLVLGGREFQSWWYPTVDTYVRLADGVSTAQLNDEALPRFVKQYREPNAAEQIVPQVFPVASLRLYGINGDGTIRFVYIFSAIAFFVLLIACVNFMNLTTARAARRALEVGVRKAVGADRRQLIIQFLGESFCVTAIALFLGLLATELLVPLLNDFTGRSLRLDFGAGWFWLGLLGTLGVVGLLSGSYPAFFLARVSPTEALRGGQAGPGNGRMRRTLVVLQFTVSVALITGTFVVYNQVGFLQSKALGFDTEQVVALSIDDDQNVIRGLETFKNELRQSPLVRHVSASNWLPGVRGGDKMPATVEGMPDEAQLTPWVLYVDDDFIETMGIEIAEGRGFLRESTADIEGAFIPNKTLLDQIGLEEPLDKRFRIAMGEFGQTVYEKEGQVIGVAADFHHHSLRSLIEPTVLTITDDPSKLEYILVRVAPGDLATTRQTIEAAWNTVYPQRNANLVFLDDQLARAYQEEAQFGKMVGVFAFLAILIACLGLFGLTAYTAEQRITEIGIRKVLGASVTSILVLLSQDIVKLVLLSIVLAMPVAYLSMSRWLEHFAYHIDVGIGTLVLSGMLALGIALATMSYQSIKAALLNPADSIRCE